MGRWKSGRAPQAMQGHILCNGEESKERKGKVKPGKVRKGIEGKQRIRQAMHTYVVILLSVRQL